MQPRAHRVLRKGDVSRTTPALASRLAALLALLLLAGPATAAEGDAPWIVLEPRVWISQLRLVSEDNLAKEAVLVPQGGASVTVLPPMLPSLGLLLTGLYGKGTGAALFEGFAVDSEVERADIELLIRYTLPSTKVSVYAGPRYVRVDETYSADFSSDSVSTLTQLVILQLGVGGFAELTDSGRHRFFGNITAGLSFRRSEYEDTLNGIRLDSKETEPTLDLNLGYQFLPTRWLGVSARYRSFLFFVAENDFGLADIVVAHGPELGVSVRF